MEIFEKYELGQNVNSGMNNTPCASVAVDEMRNQKVEKLLVQARAEFAQTCPKLACSLEKLRQNPHIIEEATTGIWDKNL